MTYSAEDFWTWFKANNKAYLFLDEVDEEVREELMSSFLTELHKYCANLYFQISGNANEAPEIVITADGDIEYFDKVEELLSKSPGIKEWKFTAFKQPIAGHFNIVWEGIEVSTENMWFIPLFSAEAAELGLRICLRGHEDLSDDDTLLNAMYVMLDTILGEKNFALNIGYVEIQPYTEEAEDEAYPILELPGYLDEHTRTIKN
ncbi:MAG TPA: hypothetical protein VG738_16750 [Chitinophagaceae bacterium]|nr:hypothetical protein [Chitinophagaceae bacterium]